MSYREGPQSYIRHNGKFYLVDKLIELTEKQPAMVKKVSDFAWVAKGQKDNKNPDFISRVKAADLRIPIIAIKEGPLWIPLDGFHRVCKAVFMNKAFLRYRLITPEQLKQALLKQEPEKDPGGIVMTEFGHKLNEHIAHAMLSSANKKE